MIKTSTANKETVGCANTKCPVQRFHASELLFICPAGVNCPGADPKSLHFSELFEGQQTRYPQRYLFRPRRYAYRVRCPVSDHQAYIKVCPHCGTQQPISMGDSSTIAVIGSSTSGKTCFITSLIHQIDEQLSRQSMYGMSLEWRDEEGRQYFRKQRQQLFDKLRLPEPTQKKAPLKSLDIIIRFPLCGMVRRFRKGPQAVIPLVFPDPAGELFQMLTEAYYLSFLSSAPQVMLMLDPLSSRHLRNKRKSQGEGDFDADVDDPEGALNSFINAIRGELGQPTGLIEKDLAVVLTKCDVPGVFNPDSDPYNFSRHGRVFDPALSKTISKHVERHLEEDLRIPKVVAMAQENFRRTCFFSATALGHPPVVSPMSDGQIEKRLTQAPQPRRVEDPFLWLLHCRGLV